MVAVDGLRMRTGPGTSNPVVGAAPDEGSDPVVLSHGQLVMIVGPATAAEGFAWYPVVAFPPVAYRPPAFTGWLADGADGSWLGDPKVQCPASPTLQQLLQIGYLAGLACYAGKTLTVSGWYPPLPPCDGCGGACDSQGVAWMICGRNHVYDLLSTTSSETGYGSFLLRIDPQHPVTLPDRGNWLTVTGHLDDPAATQCAGTAPQGAWTPLYGTFDSAAARTFCRVQFVLETGKLRG